MRSFTGLRVKVALSKLELKEGDIILADSRVVGPDAFQNVQTKYQHYVLWVHPQPGMTVEECLRTCSVQVLEETLAGMKRLNEEKSPC